MSRSRVGLALVAIREDETAAASSGISVLKYKVLAFAIGAFLIGICGSVYAYYLFQVSPEGFLILKWTLYPILMCVIGGSGTVIGPVVGSLVMTAVFTAANIYLPSSPSHLFRDHHHSRHALHAKRDRASEREGEHRVNRNGNRAEKGGKGGDAGKLISVEPALRVEERNKICDKIKGR